MKYSYTEAIISDDLQASTGLHPDVLKVLYKRGITTSDEVKSILYTNFQKEVLEQPKLKDSELAGSRIVQAVKAEEHIVIYSDYDCDGICSGCIGLESLRGLKADVDYYCNEREVDGYGLCMNGIDNILKRWPNTKLIVTVDNGIIAYNGISYATSKGVGVIVTDHHEARPELPDAVAVVNPKRLDEDYPMREICGAAVIFKVMLEVYSQMRMNPQPVLDSIDLVATATISDVMPLRNENRAIVKEGLRVMAEGRRSFFKAYLSTMAFGPVTSETLGFVIGPMINAVSRMNMDVGIAYDALLEFSVEEAKLLLKKLVSINQERKDITKSYTSSTFEQVKDLMYDNPNQKSIVLYRPDIPSGIVGIIAGRLCFEFQRPTIVFTDTKESAVLKGSARSCGDFNIKEAFDNIDEDVFAGYGGHALAAGLSINSSKLDVLIEQIEAQAQVTFSGREDSLATEIDVVIDEADCNEEYIADFTILEPCGEGFRPPLFGLKAEVVEEEFVGKEGQHLKYISKTGLQIMKWNHTNKQKIPPEKFVGTPRVQTFRGEPYIQFILP